MVTDFQRNAVVLSVVVAPVGGTNFTRRCLSSLAPQAQGKPIEVIIPYDNTRREVELLRAQFPQFSFLGVGDVATVARPGTQTAIHEIYDYLLAAGLGAAQGDVVALVQDTVIASPDWCNQVLEAHRLPYGVIGGAVEHAGKSTLNWAVYFLDFGRFQPPLPEGSVGYLTDLNVSYKRDVLALVRPLWERSYREATVNWALARCGVVLWQRPQILVRQDRGRLHLFSVLRERVAWGRLFGQLRSQEISSVKRAFYVVGSPAIPLVLLGRTAGKVFSGGRNRGHFVRSLPYLVIVTAAWCFGEFLGYVAGPGPGLPTEDRSL